MTEVVINGLQGIEIRERQIDAGTGPVSNLELLFAQRHEAATVVQTRQAINNRQGIDFASPDTASDRTLKNVTKCVAIQHLLHEGVVRASLYGLETDRIVRPAP